MPPQCVVSNGCKGSPQESAAPARERRRKLGARRPFPRSIAAHRPEGLHVILGFLVCSLQSLTGCLRCSPIFAIAQPRHLICRPTGSSEQLPLILRQADHQPQQPAAMLADSGLQAAALCSGLRAVQEPGVKCSMRQLRRQVRRGCMCASALGCRPPACLAPSAPQDRQNLRNASICSIEECLLQIKSYLDVVRAQLGKACMASYKPLVLGDSGSTCSIWQYLPCWSA